MTTPAQDAPLVLPAVAFRPVRLFLICAVITGLATLAAALLGYPMFGAFFGIGLALGLFNALLVRRSVGRITAEANPLKRKMAVNSAGRLLVITVIGLIIAYLFRPMGVSVLFGIALFEVLLVMTTALPVVKAIRRPDASGAAGSATEGSGSQQ